MAHLTDHGLCQERWALLSPAQDASEPARDIAPDLASYGQIKTPAIIGRRNASAVGTLVDRRTNYTMLVHLPDGYKPEQLQAALTRKIN